jgi:hypothetical protein
MTTARDETVASVNGREPLMFDPKTKLDEREPPRLRPERLAAGGSVDRASDSDGSGRGRDGRPRPVRIPTALGAKQGHLAAVREAAPDRPPCQVRRT